MSELETRVAKLERENRRMRRTGLVGLVALVAVFLMGQASPRKVADETRTRKLLLEDEVGRVRAVLEVCRDCGYGGKGVGGGPRLLLRDEAGWDRATLIVDAESASLILFNGAPGRAQPGRVTAEAGLEVGVGKDGPKVVLEDAGGKTRAALWLDKDGPQAALKDPGGQALLAVLKHQPGLSISDSAGQRGAALMLFKDGPGSSFRTRRRKPMLALPSQRVSPGQL